MAVNETHGAFEDILKGAKPQLRAICASARQLIGSLHKGRVEVVWPRQKIASYGVGPRKMTDHYAYIAVQAAHVNLGFYHGASLRDPSGLLEGTGRKLRHVKLRRPADLKRPAVQSLLRAAIADRERHATGHEARRAVTSRRTAARH